MEDNPLGLESGTVRVVPYDSRWPELFADEAARLELALAEEFPADRESYIERKSDFVRRVLNVAALK